MANETNFLKAIEGLGGENLSSAILCHLISTHESLKNVVLAEFLKAFGTAIYDPGSRCKCYTEVSTRNTEGVRGRLDIFLETDTVAIGIENKFLAEFSLMQPGKYVPEIRKRAKTLGERYGSDVKALLIVLVPQSREGEVRKTIINPNHVDAQDRDLVSLVTWESLLKAIYQLKSMDPIARFLVDHLSDYVKQSTGSLEWLALEYATIKDRRTSSNATLQGRFVYRIREFFLSPDSDPISNRPGSRVDRYIGYDILIRRCESGILLGWFGIYSSDAIDELSNEAVRSELVLMTNFDVELGPDFRRLARRVKWAKVYTNFWIVQFQPDWIEDSIWIERLRPLHAEIKKRTPLCEELPA